MLQLAQGEVLHKLHPLAPFAFWEDVQVLWSWKCFNWLRVRCYPSLRSFHLCSQNQLSLFHLSPCYRISCELAS